MADKKAKKMNRSDRRQSILDAARPLFAQLGYQGASVRKIAKAAGVSEALLYQHFPSKKELYQEILKYGVDVSTLYADELEKIEPGAESLAAYVWLTLSLILIEVPKHEEAQYWHERLLFQSLMGDRGYAASHFENLLERVKEPISIHIEEAEKAGDLVKLDIPHLTRFWFVHHLAMALNLCHLPGESVFKYQGSKKDLLRQAVLFSLRGLGLTDQALERCFDPEKLESLFQRMYG